VLPNAVQGVLTEDIDGLKLVIEEKQYATGSKRSGARLITTVVALGIVLLAASAGIFKLIRHAGANKAGARVSVPFGKMESTQITNMGNVWGIAISPDGQYLAYTLEDAGLQSVWLRQTRTDSSQQIVPPADAMHFQLTFSSDGSYIYYARRENQHGILTI